jgi:hypothetical protein
MAPAPYFDHVSPNGGQLYMASCLAGLVGWFLLVTVCLEIGHAFKGWRLKKAPAAKKDDGKSVGTV